MDVEVSQAPILEIAHVLFIDIVQYSELPVDDQRRAVRRLQNAISGTSDFGRFQAQDELIVLPTGDGAALVFFRDVEAPLRCALELAARLKNEAAIPVRMGIHTGSVYRVADINANHNVAGAGINMAQRVMDVGDAGHILVSKAVAEMLADVGQWRDWLHDLGEAEVKHGARVHLFNLYTGHLGNPDVPARLSSSEQPREPKGSVEEVSQPSGPAVLAEGVEIHHYRLISRLGGGGMGVVYEAEDVRLRRRVALKFLPEHLLTAAEAIERFQREARAASALNHPNICTVYDVGEYRGAYYIAMELLEGSTLKAVIPEQAVTLRQIVRWGEQITDALVSAHAKGILHRDLKPANIFATKRGDVKILDFGLAKILTVTQESAERNSSLTRSGIPIGTPAYMSPEQARGEALDGRTDLFSLGMVMYELATGQSPFPGEIPAVIFDGIMNNTPIPVTDLKPDTPRALVRIIDRALQKNKEERYQSAAEMHADFEALHAMLLSGANPEVLQQLSPLPPKSGATTGEASVAPPPAKSPPASRRSRLSRQAKIAGSLAIVILAIGLGGGLYWRSFTSHGLTDKDTIVLSDFTNTTGEPVFDDALKQGLAVQLEQSPFLSLISEHKVNDTLKLMGRAPEDRLTPAVTREVCQRTGSKAMLTGSISGLGGNYVIGLQAINCVTGDVLAETEEKAAGKTEILKSLDSAASTIRKKLGESVKSIEAYTTPLEQATTPSLEALKAYSTAKKISSHWATMPLFPISSGRLRLTPTLPCRTSLLRWDMVTVTKLR